ncbi:putative methyltransferase domain-containing protein [Colletotrichum sublineola]|uniref:Putative methyltransferase domain-containing protein n=1 Tax=Colletotrichum sublineola TaxID=1173701 RepID=A0A066Y2S3_COLSU|nr:putative methyltransferase domain-containing protein [Colletotrichum sublineola]
MPSNPMTYDRGVSVGGPLPKKQKLSTPAVSASQQIVATPLGPTEYSRRNWAAASMPGSARQRREGLAGGASTSSETLTARGRELQAPRAMEGNDDIPQQVAHADRPTLPQDDIETAQSSRHMHDMPTTDIMQMTERQGPEMGADAVGTTVENKHVPETTTTLDGVNSPESTGPAPGRLESSNFNSYDANRNLPLRSFAAPLSPLTHPNGVPMFPGMSTEQQVSESTEATTQAEGSIEADGDELSSIFDSDETSSSDGGYGTDIASNASTSIESSVRDYLYENGRRYHRFREGQYNFPNDEIEQEREDMKHAMVKLLCNQKLSFAPLGEWPQQILDMGTGTGAWAIEMGDRYPGATVLGVDLSPIQPEWVPPNVKFEVDDVESPWLYPANHFDYIHSRHTVMAIKDWPVLFQRSFEHLKAGGWIELQEIHHCPMSASRNPLSAAHPVAQYWGYVSQGLSNLGIDLNAAAGSRLPNMMREAGFINMTERVFHVPIGTWPRNRVLKTVGMYWRTILLDGLQAIALGPFTRGLQWSAEQTEGGAFLTGSVQASRRRSRDAGDSGGDGDALQTG